MSDSLQPQETIWSVRDGHSDDLIALFRSRVAAEEFIGEFSNDYVVTETLLFNSVPDARPRRLYWCLFDAWTRRVEREWVSGPVVCEASREHLQENAHGPAPSCVLATSAISAKRARMLAAEAPCPRT